MKIKTLYLCSSLFVWLYALPSQAWNALGHQIITQIAYDNLNTKTKQIANRYNHALSTVYKPVNLIKASVWLDSLRYQDIHWYDAYHYIDIPFSTDQSPLPPIPAINAQWAILHAEQTLTNHYAKPFDKGLALRILIHVVEDIHQPLHTATRVSNEYPQGDLGGNLFPIKGKPIATNLHAYWDMGAGLLYAKPRSHKISIKKQAENLENQWPCVKFSLNTNIGEWINDAHTLARSKAYTIAPNTTPTSAYQQEAQAIVSQQMAVAGCRLANLLNQLFP